MVDLVMLNNDFDDVKNDSFENMFEIANMIQMLNVLGNAKGNNISFIL